MQVDANIQEQERLDALDRLDILDTPSEESFDRVTRLTRRVFDVPIATITLVDGHRQWFKSRQGLSACESARGEAFCNHVIRDVRPLVVPDTLADERFVQNPHVVGEPHLRFYAGVPLRTYDGHSIGTICAMDTKPRSFDADQVNTLYDLAGIVINELELRVLATTDGLTGALSRRAFRDQLSRYFALAQRHRHDLSCIVLDLDHFKSINDQHGHPLGDRVLAETASACHEALRKSDAFGRIGGEEFAVLMPHTGLASSMTVAEKLRLAIARLRVPTASGTIRVTASFGVAAFDGSTADADVLLQRADAALYVAKNEGRNRCVEWKPTGLGSRSNGRRVLKAGQISFNGGHSAIDCTVHSISDDSASLKVISSIGIPEKFKLSIGADSFSRVCQVQVKGDRHLDVRFV